MRSDTAPHRRKDVQQRVALSSSLFFDSLLLFSLSLPSVFPAFLTLSLPAIFPSTLQTGKDAFSNNYI